VAQPSYLISHLCKKSGEHFEKHLRIACQRFQHQVRLPSMRHR
jgi:hypothetical protein